MIESYIQARDGRVSVASINRELAVLRRMLRLAYEWRVLPRLLRIQLLSGEHHREFVLNYEQEKVYLKACPDPLAHLVVLILDTGMRPDEAASLEWRRVFFEPVGSARYGRLWIDEEPRTHAGTCPEGSIRPHRRRGNQRPRFR